MWLDTGRTLIFRKAVFHVKIFPVSSIQYRFNCVLFGKIIILNHENFTITAFFWVCVTATARSQTAVIDSFKTQLAKAITNDQKVEILGLLSKTLMNVSLPEAEKYGKQMIKAHRAETLVIQYIF